jgi:hypothetical protein
MRNALRFGFIAIALALNSCLPIPTPEQQLADLSATTGFHKYVPPADSPSVEGNWLVKNEGGYEILFRPQMGDVWGRYAARMAIGEIGRELGHIGRFLSGSTRSGVGTMVGSPLDRVLSAAIGQPLTFYLVLKHNKPSAPRVDILSSFSTVRPDDLQPQRESIGFSAGSLYTSDSEIASRIMADKALVEKLSNFRSQYIRVDEFAVSFIFAGSERDWSAEITERGGYPQLLNDITAALSGIANKI